MIRTMTSLPQHEVTDCFTTQALRLEELLATHGVSARVGQAEVSDGAVRFPLTLGLGADTKTLRSLTSAIAHQAGVDELAVRGAGSRLFLEMPASGGGLRYGDLMAHTGRLPLDSTLLGLQEGGVPLTLQMASPETGHLLVVARSQMGKSEFLRMIGLGMAINHSARHWRLALLAGKRDGPLDSLYHLPHCFAWSNRPEHAIGWLARLHTEMRRRERWGAGDAKVLALVDDAEHLLDAGGKVARHLVRSLLDDGQAAGIHLVMACRDASALGTLAERFPVRLQGSATQIAGRFLLHNETHLSAVTAVTVEPSEVERVVRQLRYDRPRLLATPIGEAA